jgi:radical SAM superfamily enzyme YgiQ (UPF0313 family)
MKNVLIIVLPYLQQDQSAPSTKLRTQLAMPYGALSIATYIKDTANVKFIDCNTVDLYKLTITNAMHEYKPDIVGFSMTFDYAYNYLEELLGLVKGINPECITVAGGAATISAYRDMLNEQPLLDAVCFADGEVPMMELVKSNSPLTCLFRSTSWITRVSIVSGIAPMKSPVANLDDTIALDYSLINPDNYSLQEEFSPYVDDIPVKKRFYILTSRGCPYACKFCYKSRIKDKKMQYASVEKVIEEVKRLVDQFGMNILTLCDDQLLFNQKRAKELFRQLIPFNLRVEIYQGTSVDFIDDEMAELMYAAGMRRVMINLESGSQTMLDIMIEKPVHLDKAKEIIKILRKHKIWTSCIFVMGYPGETDGERKETMGWIKEADPDWCVFNAAIPIRGTVLYDLCIKNGYIKRDKLGKLDYGNYTINVPRYPAEYVKGQVYKMNLEANFVNNRSIRIGDYQTAIKMFKQVIAGYPNHAFAYYYLSECYRITKNNKIALVCWSKFNEIVSADSQWTEYAKYFKLGRYK